MEADVIVESEVVKDVEVTWKSGPSGPRQGWIEMGL
jgi:hypothetical protein